MTALQTERANGVRVAVYYPKGADIHLYTHTTIQLWHIYKHVCVCMRCAHAHIMYLTRNETGVC